MGMGNIANTGMQAAMSNMDIISNNIANANTYGFKRASANFADLFPSGNDASSVQIGLGVAVTGSQEDFTPGGPSAPTNLASDFSIGGNGFFIMKDATSGQSTYSRYGHFGFDRTTGFFTIGNSRLQGFPAVNGSVPAGSTPADLHVNTAPVPAVPTTLITQSGLNLSASDVIPVTTPFDPNTSTSYNYTTGSKIVDSLGTQHDLNIYYVKTGSNAWGVNVYVDGNVITNTATMTFTSAGALNTTTGLTGLNYVPGTGATSPQTFDISMTQATQFGSPDGANPFTVNGYGAGEFQSYTVDKNGIVNATYTNGPPVVVGQIALAEFQSPQGLVDVGNQSWTANTASGAPIINQSNSTGIINQGTLELSNVDLATEMVNLINAQNTFQANAQVEQVYNQVMQTVTKL